MRNDACYIKINANFSEWFTFRWHLLTPWFYLLWESKPWKLQQTSFRTSDQKPIRDINIWKSRLSCRCGMEFDWQRRAGRGLEVVGLMDSSSIAQKCYLHPWLKVANVVINTLVCIAQQKLAPRGPKPKMLLFLWYTLDKLFVYMDILEATLEIPEAKHLAHHYK